MKKLDPSALFERLAGDIPGDLRANLFVTGSLAAAYHFQSQLEGRAINTKDADLVVHPAGNVISCRQMAGPEYAGLLEIELGRELATLVMFAAAGLASRPRAVYLAFEKIQNRFDKKDKQGDYTGYRE